MSRKIMSKRTILIAGLVLIALAGTLTAIAMASDEPASPKEFAAADNGAAVEVQIGESFTVVLPGNPTTGYSWVVDGIDPAILAATEPAYVGDSDLIGSGGAFTFTFTAMGAGETTVRLVYERSWEQTEPLETFTLTVTVP
jgi:inhibitor of cysteine peptidase